MDIKTVSNMKQNLTGMINRVDLLTDVKIGEIKVILNQILDKILKLTKRVERFEFDKAQNEYEKLPVDVLALTKDEVTLRTDLAKMILEC